MSGTYKQVSERELGRQGYDAYTASTGYDRQMPSWEELPETIKKAWTYAGVTIAKRVYAAVRASEPCPDTQPAPKGYPSL